MLVHVAVALVGLLAFSAVTIDLGVLWVARAEAQNAADAAALAGAVTLAYGDAAALVTSADAGRAVAAVHAIVGDAAAGPTVDVQTAACPSGSPEAAASCVRATIERGGASGPPLPAHFARLFGIQTQQVRATAHATVLMGNTTTCLKPWVVPDSWIDRVDEHAPIDTIWTEEDRFEKYEETTPGVIGALRTPHDEYDPPTAGGVGSGYGVARIGDAVVFDPAYYHDLPLVAGEYFPVELPRAVSSGDPDADFFENIRSCNGSPVSIGDTLTTDLNIHPYNTESGIQALIDQDPNAHWDGTAVRGSAFAVSPRVVAIAIFDPDQYVRQYRQGQQRVSVVVRNIMGMFLRQTASRSVDGVIVPLPGMYDGGVPGLTEQASFLRTVALVR